MGPDTDWGFVNQMEIGFSFENTGQTEDIIPVLNNTFSLFSFGNFNVAEFPPLKGSLGDLIFERGVEPILYQQLRGVGLYTQLLTI